MCSKTVDVSQRLPQEMLEEVIGHLKDERATLLSCSLASSVLLPASRRLLFSDIRLLPYEIKAAIRLLGASCGTIARAICSLTITDRTTSSTSGKVLTRRVDVSPMPDILSLRERLHHLKRLSFEAVCDFHIPSEFWTMVNGLRRVQEVQVIQMSCFTSQQFFSLMSSLPALETFTVFRSRWWGPDLGLLSPSTNVRHIPVLDIDSSGQQHVLKWLLNREIAPTVDTLRLDVAIDLETALLAQRLLGIVGPAVNKFHLSLMNGVHEQDIMNVMNLGACTNVHSLHVENRYDPQGQLFLHDLLMTLFPQFKSATALKEVSWTVAVNRIKTFDDLSEDIILRRFNWHVLSKALHESIGDQLEKLRISVTGYPERLHEPTEKYLRGVCFPRFADDGKLDVRLVASR